MVGAKVIILVFRYAHFPRMFGSYLSRQPGWNFSYEAKAKFVPVTGLMWRGPQKYTACNENDTYNKIKSELIYHKDYLFPLRPD